MMKKLISALVLSFIVFSSAASAATREGRLVAKLQGELDPFVLGDGCISVIEYQSKSQKKLLKIAIYQDDNNEACISEDVAEGEEIDFDFAQLSRADRDEKKVMKDLVTNVMNVRGVKSWFRM